MEVRLPDARQMAAGCLLLAALFASGCGSNSRQLLDQAESSWRKGRYYEAVQANLDLYKLEPKGRYSPGALLNIGNIYYLNLRQLNQAIEYYNRLTREFPGSPETLSARRQLADIYANEIQDLNQAIEEYTRILEYPDLEDRPEILFRRADAYFKKEDYYRAMRELRGLEESGVTGHLADQVSLRIGNIYMMWRQFSNAVEPFRKVLTAPCMDCRRRAILNLTDTYENLFDFDRALQTIALLDKSPENEELIRTEVAHLEQRRTDVENRVGVETTVAAKKTVAKKPTARRPAASSKKRP